MLKSSVHEDDRTQLVRLPADCRFPADVKNVVVRVQGHERILSPVDHSWDSFFLAAGRESEDLLAQRASQQQKVREAL